MFCSFSVVMNNKIGITNVFIGYADFLAYRYGAVAPRNISTKYSIV